MTKLGIKKNVKHYICPHTPEGKKIGKIFGGGKRPKQSLKAEKVYFPRPLPKKKEIKGKRKKIKRLFQEERKSLKPPPSKQKFFPISNFWGLMKGGEWKRKFFFVTLELLQKYKITNLKKMLLKKGFLFWGLLYWEALKAGGYFFEKGVLVRVFFAPPSPRISTLPKPGLGMNSP